MVCWRRELNEELNEELKKELNEELKKELNASRRLFDSAVVE